VKLKLSVFGTAIMLVSSIAMPVPAWADDGWVDVHFHVVGDKGAMEGFREVSRRLDKIMRHSDIAIALVMSPPRPFQSYDVEELQQLQEQLPGRVAIMGGGGSLNPMIQAAGHDAVLAPELKRRFEARAEEILAAGVKGFGEITAHHVSLNPHHGYESVPADHPLLLLLADIAARHDVPIDFHFDPIPRDMPRPEALKSPKNPAVFKENIHGFENLLAHNPGAKIVWAHAGSDPVGYFTPELVRRLMERHPNLYCSIRTTLNRNHPMRHPRRGINDDWIDVLKAFPDRFVFGTDSFLVTGDYTGPDGPKVFEHHSRIQREGVKQVMAYLDEALARKIGRDNAVRIYHLDE